MAISTRNASIIRKGIYAAKSDIASVDAFTKSAMTVEDLESFMVDYERRVNYSLDLPRLAFKAYERLMVKATERVRTQKSRKGFH